jgi:CheY-like chemotaxis protein
MRRVLLVHDQQESPAIRREFLEQVGYEVILADSDAKCLDAIDSKPPDVVVMDILIKGRNGFETCRAIRDRYTATELPVILSTGVYRKSLYRDEAAAAGAQCYLVRPFGLDVLVQQIQGVLSGVAETSSVTSP